MDELSVKESDCIRKSAFTKESISTFFMVNLENRNEGSYLNCLEGSIVPHSKGFFPRTEWVVCAKQVKGGGRGKVLWIKRETETQFLSKDIIFFK